MIALLSPAKTLDFSECAVPLASTKPAFQSDAARLVKAARELSAAELGKLMSVSEKLADLNHQRFRDFRLRPGDSVGKPAALAFKGDVYLGLEAETLAPADLEFAQDHLRILSGLYGLLRPLDRIQPYRLEMGSSLQNPRGKNLYQYWGDRIAKALRKELKAAGQPVVVNLASNEYFKAADLPALKSRVITPVFKEIKDGKAKVISFVAKRSRGMMARWLIEKRVTDPAAIRDFRLGDYRFQAGSSDENRWEFHRKHRTLAG